MFVWGGDHPFSSRSKKRPLQKTTGPSKKIAAKKNLLTISIIYAILYSETEGAKNDFEMDNQH